MDIETMKIIWVLLLALFVIGALAMFWYIFFVMSKMFGGI